MKPVWKHTIAAFCALIVISYGVFGVWMSYHRMASPKCGAMRVVIEDETMRQYVSEAEIRQLVEANDLNPVGLKQNKIVLQRIENLVRQHSMIRTGECYKTMCGDVCVCLTQRVPLVRIMTSDETYFVDTDRKLMPVRASVKTPVLLVTGHVGKRMAVNEISSFAEWLEQEPYWKQRIAKVEICGPKMVHLIQNNGEAMIVLGDWSGFARKLGKLRHWYDGCTGIDLKQYPVVDVRYHGQVLGVKAIEEKKSDTNV